MKKFEKWIIGIIITLIISLGTIALLYWFPHCWNVNSLSTDGLSGILGAIITSLVTLGALFITTIQTRKQIRENKEEQERKHKELINFQLKKERKELINIVAIDLSTYIADICKYFYAQPKLQNKIDKEENEVKCKIDTINKQSKDKVDKEEKIKEIIEESVDKVKKITEKEKIDRYKAIDKFFLLHIKLDEITLAKHFLFHIDQIHNKYCFYSKNTNINQIKKEYCEEFNIDKTTFQINTQNSIMNDLVERTKEEFKKFAKQYINEDEI